MHFIFEDNQTQDFVEDPAKSFVRKFKMVEDVIEKLALVTENYKNGCSKIGNIHISSFILIFVVVTIHNLSLCSSKFEWNLRKSNDFLMKLKNSL